MGDVDEATLWSRVRSWLHLGPTRAELVAEARLWQSRADRAAAEMREAHVRAKAAERRLRAEQGRSRELEAKMTALLVAKLNEPERLEGCGKVRFHRLEEARGWAVFLAGKSGEDVDVFDVYACRTCPRSPVTMRRYFHVGHGGAERAQESKARAKRERGTHRERARRDGKLIEQRVDPTVLDKLRKLTGST